ncbi:hypothetical protein TNCV_3324821 [Trichonephila clavipes]|nr:hypothetical protein TNCV_3324821 [Trichonephila clavipes]
MSTDQKELRLCETCRILVVPQPPYSQRLLVVCRTKDTIEIIRFESEKSTTKAVGNGSRNFESRSIDKDDTPSPNYFTNGITLRLDRFNMDRLALHGGSSVASGLESTTRTRAGRTVYSQGMPKKPKRRNKSTQGTYYTASVMIWWCVSYESVPEIFCGLPQRTNFLLGN